MSEGLCRPECAVDPTDPTPCGYLGPGWECGPDGLCIPDIPDPFADAGTMDGGGMDSGVVDTGTMDAGGDTGPVDGGPDTGADAGPDVGPDADAGPDTGLDAGPCRADRFWGPVPYLSEADLPTDFMPTPRSYALLENFESVPTLMPGFSPVSGTPSSMGGVVDSVDSDDGTIDGVCTGCEAWFGTAASGGIVFDFVATALPGRQLPTRVGLAWTDGGGNVTLEAFGACGSLGTVVGMGLGDGDFLGGTAEDRFFGVQWSGGISSIRINNDGAGGIEVDHLHFVRD